MYDQHVRARFVREFTYDQHIEAAALSSSVNSRTISTFEPTSYVNSRMTSSPLAFEALRVHGVRSRSAFEEAVEATGSRLFEVTGSKPLARDRKLVHFNARVALVSLYLYISISLSLSLFLSFSLTHSPTLLSLSLLIISY